MVLRIFVQDPTLDTAFVEMPSGISERSLIVQAVGRIGVRCQVFAPVSYKQASFLDSDCGCNAIFRRDNAQSNFVHFTICSVHLRTGLGAGQSQPCCGGSGRTAATPSDATSVGARSPLLGLACVRATTSQTLDGPGRGPTHMFALRTASKIFYKIFRVIIANGWWRICFR